MSYNTEQLQSLNQEIETDPLSYGYAGKTADWILAKINEPGSASAPNRVLIVSETPVYVPYQTILGVALVVDGTVRVGACVEWIRASSHALAKLVNEFMVPGTAAAYDIASAVGRDIIGRMSNGQVENPPDLGAPDHLTPISEEARDAIYALGEILMSRSREICGQSATLADVTAAMAL